MKSFHIGVIVFPRVDQIDVTGPFEVFSRIPGATVHLLAKEVAPVRDVQGLILTPEKTINEAPDLDILHIPGGFGQEALMDEEETLAFIRRHHASGRYTFSVCTGALICGAAGILRGRRATTHWSAFDLLPYFGAVAVDERVVVDGNLVTCAGVTAGIDGALLMTSMLCNDATAQAIQLAIQYAPEPPFSSGTPASAPPAVREKILAVGKEMKAARLATAERIAKRLRITPV